MVTIVRYVNGFRNKNWVKKKLELLTYDKCPFF